VPARREYTQKLTSSKITDKDLPKSRRQQKEERAEPRHTDYVPPPKEITLKRKRDATEHDPKLKEFLNVMQPPSKLKAWANEETQIDASIAPAIEPVEEVVVTEGESDDEYQVLAKTPKTTQRKPSVEADSAPTKKAKQPKKEKENNAGNEELEQLPDAPIPEQGPVSDADWLRSRTNRVLDLVEDDEEAPRPDLELKIAEDDIVENARAAMEQPGTSDKEDEAEAGATPSEEDKIRQTGRLFLRNLHYDVTEDDLRVHFSTYGSLEEVSSERHGSHYFCYDEYPDRDN
jgi:multiple RNA-binding domain-containing protein 1